MSEGGRGVREGGGEREGGREGQMEGGSGGRGRPLRITDCSLKAMISATCGLLNCDNKLCQSH